MKNPLLMCLVIGAAVATSARANGQPELAPEPAATEPPVATTPPSDSPDQLLRPQLADPGIWGGTVRPLGVGPIAPAPIEPDVADLPFRLYGGAEYLLWWIRAQPLPALVTTSPPASNGILGMPGTAVLFGNNSIPLSPFSGVRYTIGYWFGEESRTAFEFTGFVLGQSADHFDTNSGSNPVLARPFFNVNTQAEFSEIVASPGLATGSVAIDAFSRLWGMEANGRRRLPFTGPFRFDLVGGFRYLDLEEGLTIVENLNALPGVFGPLATQGIVSDQFHTRNQFYGGQFGGRMEFRYARLFLDLQAKVALGDMSQTVSIFGGQTVTPAGGPTTPFVGGLLALPSNIGTFNRDRFAVVPEADFNVGYQVARFCRLFVGYSFVCASTVVRPADQIDRSLNVAQIPNFGFPPPIPPGPTRPLSPFASTAFWAQGLNFSCEFRY
jgi:hypothetical protein